jgi:hypothetical protein
LSSDSENGSVEKQDSKDKSENGAAAWGDCNMATTGHYPKLKIYFGGKSEVKQIPTDCISVSGRLPGDMRKHLLEKIIGCGQGK